MNKKGVRAFYAKPLTQLTKNVEPDRVLWTPEGDQAFHSLRKLLCNECMLTTPLASDCFRLQTDASGLGIGAALSVIPERMMSYQWCVFQDS